MSAPAARPTSSRACGRPRSAAASRVRSCRSATRSQLSQSAQNGSALLQQRQQVLQQMSRYGCDQQGSGARFSGGTQQPPGRRSFLQDLFGGIQGQDGYGDTYTYDGQESIEDPYANQQAGYTIRTVCVRLSDGYYWPISYSTTRDYIPEDDAACQSECPNQQVALYYYDNPGQEPEQMVNQQGEAYTSLPSAFAYRKQIDLANSCKPQEVFGKITLETLPDGRSRAMISYADDKFPLPMRDPRQTETATAAPAGRVAVLDVPLPRPRPRPNAPSAAPAPTPAPDPVVSAKSRTVRVGDKIVRVVGPQTPYAPAVGDGAPG